MNKPLKLAAIFVILCFLIGIVGELSIFEKKSIVYIIVASLNILILICYVIRKKRGEPPEDKKHQGGERGRP